MQSDPSVAQATPTPKKSNAMLILAVVLVLALAGTGFWGFQQSSALKTTQAELANLQAQHESLTAEKNQLSADFDATKADLDTTKADLEKTQGDLTSTQADLTKAQDQGKATQTKIDKASKIAEILYAFSTVATAEDILKLDGMVKATNDTKMLAEWNKFLASPTVETSNNFMLYLITAIRDGLK